MSTCNKKICIKCNITPVASGNKKFYCDKCFLALKISKKNKVDIMKPIVEESNDSDNIKLVIKEVVKEVVIQQYQQ
jgi:hypothetical protein